MFTSSLNRRALRRTALSLIMAAAALLALAWSSQAANTIVWQSAAKGLPTTGTYLNDVAFGDVNNDGQLDLVGAHSNSGGIVVWAGDGAGNWSNANMNNGLPATGNYARVALGDVNRDGKLDIVATGASNNGIHVYLGDGAGTWTESSSNLPATGTFAGVAVADKDGDGQLDIFAASAAGAGIKVYLNDLPRWAATTVVPTTTGSYGELAVGYIDRDGYLDLVAANTGSTSGIYAWRGNYDGSWTTSSTGLPTTGGYRGVAVGDINNDGKSDIVASGYAANSGIQALLGDGYGSWSVTDPITSTGSFGQLALGDLNNDGRLDLAANAWSANGPYGARVWLGGSGGWTAGPSPQTTGSLYSVALGDLDNDGLLDVAAGDGVGAGWRVWRNAGVVDPLGTWREIVSPQTTGSPRALATGDLNLDGNLDVVVARPDGGLNAWKGNGGNTWIDCNLNRAAYTGTIESAIVGRFGQFSSQYPDVIGARWDGHGIEYYFNNIGICYWNSWSITSTGYYRGLSTGDIDANGYPDLVAAKWAGGIQVWEHGASGWASRPGPTSTTTFYDTALGDFNHDGKLDIVAAGYDGQGVRVYLYNSPTTWTSKIVTATGKFHTVAVGDLNNDGHLDIVAAKNSSGQEGIYLWLGDGTGNVWTPWLSPATTVQYFDLDLGDFNHDGKLDILAARDGYGVSVWAGDGAGNWTPYNTNLPSSGAFFNALFGHIDHDGNPDILATQLYNGLRMWTAGEASPPTFANFWPTGWITNTRSPSPYVDVLDTGSGLNVNTAAYRYSTNGGASWSGYFSATISGASGVTSTQTMTATNVPFGQDSADQNLVEFRIADVAGNANNAQYTVQIDITPPNAPTSLSSTDHTVSTWSNDNTINVSWSGASDATSGVSGYSVLFDQLSTTLPNATIETYGDSFTSGVLADATNWYAHVRTRDAAGNWSATARHSGPYWIDTTPPNNPSTVSSSSHTPSTWSADNTIAMSWSGASDAGSGVSGYSYVWDTSSSTLPDTVAETSGTSTTSSARSTGSSHWFHIRTRDAAGNWAATAVHRGPYYIDTTAPSSSTSSPASVGSTSFTVSWSGSDSGSGIDSYDVQYKNVTTGGSWTTWKSAVSYLSSSFSGTDGHTYQFRSRARDNVGNLESYPSGYDSPTAVATVDFFVKNPGIEVTQGVQDLNNSVTLIAGKRTFVRCLVQSDAGTYASIPARLRVYRGAAYMGVLLPANAGGTISVRTNPDRGQLNHSYYFDVPVGWLNAGSVRFECEVNTPQYLAENDYTNNLRSVTVNLVNSPVMNLLMVDVPYRFNSVVRHVRDVDRTLLESWLRRAYPIKTLNVWWGYLDPPYNSLPSAATVNGDLSWNKSKKVLGASEDPWTRYYGMAIDTGGFMRGLAVGIPSTVASGPTGPAGGWDTDASYGDWYGGHELGHTYGRKHVTCTGTEVGPDPSYPYPNGDISPNQNAASASAIYGFDSQGPTIYPPSWKDVMTYCANQWLSDYTYEAIYNRMIAEKPVSAAQIQAWRAASVEYLAVFGTIITATDTITLNTLYRVPNAFDVFGRVPGDYSIRLFGAGGTLLADYPFTPRFGSESAEDPGMITEYVTWTVGTRQVTIWHGSTALITRTVSTNAPTVTLTYPNGGETLSGSSVTVTWTGSDLDGDTLTYSLDYSRDGGATWEPLSASITATQAVLDLTHLPGTTQGKFQVWASDGVNTAVDASNGTFAVTTKGPSVSLLAPTAGSSYIFSQTISLEGSAYDPEDGPLSGAALQWTSSLAGSLGSGTLLQLSDLITGTHVITLTARDSQGNTATATTQVLVDVPQYSIYLPLVLRASP